MADPGLGLADPPPAPRPSRPQVPSERPGADRDAAISATGSQLELRARPLRHDVSGIMAQFLILMAVILCPLLVAPWLWYRRERFRLNRCRVRIDGEVLHLYHRQQQLLTLDLRYTTRQLTGAGDLVLSEEAAHYVALGVDPPEHSYPDPADRDAHRGAGSQLAALAAGAQPAAPDHAAFKPPQIRTWRAVRLAQADLARLYAAIAAVPVRPQPEAADAWSLLQALGSVGATGKRVEGQLAQLVLADLSQARPSSLVAMLQQRATEQGPTAIAARRVLHACA